MKKNILGLLLFISTFGLSQKSHGLEIGAYVGLPIAKNVNDFYSFSGGLNVAYTHPVTKNLNLGISTGWTHFFENNKNNFLGANFFPLAAKFKYNLNAVPLNLNLDFGTVLYGSSNFGVYAFPKLGYQFNKHELYLGYQHLGVKWHNSNNPADGKKNVNYGTFNVGYNLNIGL